jgi:MFS family permease
MAMVQRADLTRKDKRFMPSDDHGTLERSQIRAEVLNTETREEIIRADGKATTLMSVLGLILGALLAGAVAGSFSPQPLHDSVEWIFWIGVSFAFAAEAALCSAVWPRLYALRPKENLRFFGHVAQFESTESLHLALQNVDSNYDRLVDQVYALSKIIVRKYQLVRSALFLLSLSISCCTVSMVVNHYIS